MLCQRHTDKSIAYRITDNVNNISVSPLALEYTL